MIVKGLQHGLLLKVEERLGRDVLVIWRLARGQQEHSLGPGDYRACEQTLSMDLDKGAEAVMAR